MDINDTSQSAVRVKYGDEFVTGLVGSEATRQYRQTGSGDSGSGLMMGVGIAAALGIALLVFRRRS